MQAKRPMAIKGFTLIELLIVVVILAILAGIGYPNYTKWVSKTRRGDAQQTLLQVAAQMEKMFTECNTYPSGDITDARGCAGGLGYNTALSPDGFYELHVEDEPADGTCPRTRCFVLTATPVVGKSQENDGKLRINSLGQKTWDKADNNSFAVNWNGK